MSSTITAQWAKILDRPEAGRHILQLYKNDNELGDALEQYVRSGHKEKVSTVVLTTPEHKRLVTKRMGDLASKMADQGSLRFIDAQSMLSKFMVKGAPNWRRFQKEFSEILSQSKPHARMRVFGEQVNLLWQAGQPKAAITVEKFWSALGNEFSFALFCAYKADWFDEDFMLNVGRSLHRFHTYFLVGKDRGRYSSAFKKSLEATLGEREAFYVQRIFNHDGKEREDSFEHMVFWVLENMPQTSKKIFVRAQSIYDEA